TDPAKIEAAGDGMAEIVTGIPEVALLTRALAAQRGRTDQLSGAVVYGQLHHTGILELVDDGGSGIGRIGIVAHADGFSALSARIAPLTPAAVAAVSALIVAGGTVLHRRGDDLVELFLGDILGAIAAA